MTTTGEPSGEALGRRARIPATGTEAAAWSRASAAFASLLDVPEAERAAWLERLGERDPVLRRDVESLLAAHRRSSVLDHFPLDAVLSELLPPLEAAHGGATVAQYRLEERAGGGGMGVVFRAWDQRLERPVALKFLTSLQPGDAAARERLFVEAQAAGRLDHPNICTIYEVGEAPDGRSFIAMPYYEGETLRQRMAHGPLPVAEAVHLALQAARGLGKAHEHGIVHRDIKPANLIVTTDGVLKIVDFGIASLTDGRDAFAGGARGTVSYMSPEQTRGAAVDARSDLWSLGVVLYEVLAGVRPFRGADTAATFAAIRGQEPEPLGVRRADVPTSLDRLVRAALAKSPAGRPASAAKMADELEAIALLVGSAPGHAMRPRTDATRAAADAGEERQVAILALRWPRSSDVGHTDATRAEGKESHRRVIVARAAERHGGVVNGMDGDGAIVLFGVPAAREDDCLRAARAALEVIAEDGAAHAGIDAGGVVVRPSGEAEAPFLVTGSTLHAAARLAALASAGRVRVGPSCRRLVEPPLRLAPRDGDSTPGDERPVTSWEVAGESEAATRLEAAWREGDLTPYTGREHEIAIVRACLDDACAGRGRFVAIIGEAGMGKSRLLQELWPVLDARQVAVLRGRCLPHGAGSAYLPFVDVVRGVLGLPEGRSSEAAVAEAVARLHDESPALDEFVPLYLHLVAAAPAGERIPQQLHGERFSLIAQEAIAACLVERSRRSPLALLLEDWHWSDDASRAVLRQIVELAGEHALFVAVTCRPGYIADWGAVSSPVVVSLEPLAPDPTAALVHAVLGAAGVPDTLGTLLHERTGGNPFFVEEICHALVEDGALRVSDGAVEIARPIASLTLPGTVQAVIRARLDRLDPESREVLRVASVVGREFARDVLEPIVGARIDLHAALQALKAAGLIQQIRVAPSALYRFRHVLMQEVVYAGLLMPQRRALHGQVGMAIESLAAPPSSDQSAQLAHHFGQAEAWAKAVHYGVLAAERAAAVAEFSEAMVLLEGARTLLMRLPDGEERRHSTVDVLLRQERLGETLGLRDRQQRLIDEMMALLPPDGDRAQLAEALLRKGDLCTLLRRFEEAEQALGRALELRRALHDAVGARHVIRSLGLLRWHQGRDEDALALMEQALAMDRERGDTFAMVGDLSNLGYVLKGLRRFEAAHERLQEGIDLAIRLRDATDDPSLREAIALKRHYLVHNLANVHRELGHADLALELMRGAAAEHQGRRLPIQLSYHYTSIAHLSLQLGHVEESLEHYRMAVDLTRRAGFAPGLCFSLRLLGELLIALHRAEEALPLLEEAVTLVAQLAQRQQEADIRASIARIHEDAGRDPEALSSWARTRTLRRELRDAAGELAAVEGLARITRRHVSEPSLAVQYYRDAAVLAAALDDRLAEGRVRNVLGILEWEQQHWDAALSEYEAALDAFERCDDPDGVGLALNSIGAVLRAQGRASDARAALERALAHNEREGRAQLLAHSLGLLGEIELDGGSTERATALLQRSLAIRNERGDCRGAGWMQCHLARAAAASGSRERSRTLLESGAAAARECGDAALAEACERLRRTAGL